MALSELPYGRGDIILVSNDPKPDDTNEQKGTRPWLIVSQKEVNEHSPFAWGIPFTRTVRSYYTLAFDWTHEGPATKTMGTLLCDQIAALDVRKRKCRLLEHTEVPSRVDDLIQAVLGYK